MKKVRKAIEILEKTNDGFKIAIQNLRQRGPGQILGESQHGLLDFKFANIFNKKIIDLVQEINHSSPKLATQIYKKIFR